jgi:hypothetical protein
MGYFHFPTGSFFNLYVVHALDVTVTMSMKHIAHRVQTGSGGPPSLLYNGYRGVKLTTNLHLVPRSRMVELYLHSPIRLLGVVLN